MLFFGTASLYKMSASWVLKEIFSWLLACRLCGWIPSSLQTSFNHGKFLPLIFCDRATDFVYRGKTHTFLFRPDFSLPFDVNLLIVQFCAVRQVGNYYGFYFVLLSHLSSFISSLGFPFS